MQFVNNEQVQIQIRKDQNTLIVVGTGTIIFGLWTVAKMLGMVFILRKETIAALKENYEGVAEIPDNFVFWGILVMTFIIMAAIHAFDGLVSTLRANESRTYGAHWRLKMAYGVTNILIAIAVIVGNAVFKEPRVTTYIYGIGLMYSAVLRIITAVRRTRIVYIQ